VGIFCLTVDLDEIRCYHGIHGLDPPEGIARTAVYGRALERVARFVDRLKIPATVFVVGNDLEAVPEAGSVLRDLVGQGCEVGNHTLAHRYDLTLLGPDEQAREVEGGAEAVERIVGSRPRGFRAPGYNVHLGLLDLLEDRGYLYDSSVFPCPVYYLAKAGAIGLAGVKGRPSASIMGDPRALLSPDEPYRVGREGVWSKGDGLVELPISVITSLRVPFIGTALTLVGRIGAAVLARSAARMRFVNLELHGIDFVDAEGDGVAHLIDHQPDLGVPLVRKITILERVVRIVLDAGMEPMSLADAAGRMFL
jgi:peptidoglycan/xylan/chitin deacetylase (PgdA/CDA1 family)